MWSMVAYITYEFLRNYQKVVNDARGVQQPHARYAIQPLR